MSEQGEGGGESREVQSGVVLGRTQAFTQKGVGALEDGG